MQCIDRLDVARRGEATGRLHDLQAATESTRSQPDLDLREGAVRQARGVRFDDCRIGSRQFPHDRAYLYARDYAAFDAALTDHLLGNFRSTPLVLGSQETPQEANGYRRYRLIEEVVDGGSNIVLVDRDHHLAGAIHSFGHAADGVPGHDRVQMPMSKGVNSIASIVFRPSLLAALDEKQVLEAAGDDQPGLLATARQQSIENRGRAVADDFKFRETLTTLDVPRVKGVFDGRKQTVRYILRCGRRLADDKVAMFVNHERVGERAPDVEIAKLLSRCPVLAHGSSPQSCISAVQKKLEQSARASSSLRPAAMRHREPKSGRSQGRA